MKYKLKQSQWDLLKAELEKKATGATLHSIIQTYAKTKDRVEAWCLYMNGNENYKDMKKLCFKWKGDAIEQLKKYGYDDLNQFIEKR